MKLKRNSPLETCYKTKLYSQTEVAKQFNISQAQVWNVVTGAQWSDIK